MKSRALFVLAAVFFTAFIGRIAVLASELEAQADNRKIAANTGKPQDAECLNAELAVAIRKRIDVLQNEEAALEARKSELAAYEAQIEKRLGELENANRRLSALANQRKSETDADVAKLAAIYNGMKPAQASAIMSEMDPKFAAGLLAAMNSEQASAVVAAMDSDRAYLVSVLLANRSFAN